MQNHRQRPEIQQAAEAGLGTATRYSSTLDFDMVYLALPIERGGAQAGFVRVAAATGTINAQLRAMQRTLWSFALGLGGVALVLSYSTVARIIRPLTQLTASAQSIAAGRYSGRVAIDSRDEIGALARAFSTMQHELSTRMNELRMHGERLSTVLGSMVEGVIAVDHNERVLLANEAGRQLLGFSMPDVVGRPLREATRSRPVYAAVGEAFGSQEPQQGEFDVPGTGRVLAFRATRLPGEPCPGVVVVLHDVTELRRLENLRREFVANVSHELKTPLASIKAYAETLRLGAVHDQEHNLAFVERIEEQAERLHQLILDLLRLAQVESAQRVFDITDVSLAGLVENCLRRHSEAAAAKNISLSPVPPQCEVLVRADEDGLQTILDNLVDNAIKYTPDGGQVSVGWWSDDGQAVLEVRDTGIGIAPQDRQRVFERFYRADKARSRELGGTGLGLSIVKHLSQAFGGSVGLTSEPGQGSTFRVRLPLAETE